MEHILVSLLPVLNFTFLHCASSFADQVVTDDLRQWSAGHL